MNTLVTCAIAGNALSVNGKVVYKHEGAEEDFLKELYRHLNVEYLKFFKMDGLSKLGFLLVEAMVQHYPDVKNYKDDEVALVFSNRVSSLDTDQRYWKGVTAETPMASPALFVYTLPNIVQGEVAIRHKWFGENLFLVNENYDPGFLRQQAEMLFATCKAKACLLVWADYLDGKYEAKGELVSA